MIKFRTIVMFLVFTCLSAPTFAGEEDAILGKWWNKEKDAQVDVHKCGTKICGKIVWLKEPVYPAGSTEGTPGSSKVDVHNKDESLRTRPIMGLLFLPVFPTKANKFGPEEKFMIRKEAKLTTVGLL